MISIIVTLIGTYLAVCLIIWTLSALWAFVRQWELESPTILVLAGIFVVVLAAWCFDISIGRVLQIAFPTLAFAGMLAGSLGLARRFPYAVFAIVALLILGVWGAKQSVEQTSTFADRFVEHTP